MPGRITNTDIKSTAELDALSAPHSELPNDDRIWVKARSINKTLNAAIVDENLLSAVVSEFNLANNQTTFADVTGMIFNKATTKEARIEFRVYRYTTGGGGVELEERGSFLVSHKTVADEWRLGAEISAGDDAGVEFSITSAGQVQYKTTNIGGTPSVSKIRWFAMAPLGL